MRQQADTLTCGSDCHSRSCLLNSVMVTWTLDHVHLTATMFAVQLYARKLGACLLEMSESESCSASQDLHRWITELTALLVCVSLGNPMGLKAFHSASMDGSPASVRQLPDSFYEDLLVCSDCQALVLDCESLHDMLADYFCRNSPWHLLASVAALAPDRKVVPDLLM